MPFFSDSSTARAPRVEQQRQVRPTGCWEVVSAAAVAEVCEVFARKAELLGDEDGVYPLLEAVTACEDYDRFLQALTQILVGPPEEATDKPATEGV